MAAKKNTVVSVESLNRQEVYPFTSLKVGGTFTVADLSKWNSIRSSASRKGKKLKRTFSVARDKIKENGVETDVIMVTRTA